MSAFRTMSRLAVFLVSSLVNAAGWPQAAAQPAAGGPDDFMRKAANAMSLSAPDMKPWHLRARFKSFNPDGSVSRETVMEEWWASPGHLKVAYTAPDLARTDFRQGSTNLFIGSEKLVPVDSGLVIHPLPSAVRLDQITFTETDLTVDSVPLRCFTDSSKSGEGLPVHNSYCFDEDLPVLRVSQTSAGGMQTTWDSIVQLQGHYVAKRIATSDASHRKTLAVDVEVIESAPSLDEAAVAPPPGAKPFARQAVPPSFVTFNKIAGNQPNYPNEAKRANVQGTVVLQVSIDRQGAVVDARVFSGPLMLQQAALDAVRTWKFRPFLLNGDPMEAETTVNVVFRLGNRRASSGPTCWTR